MEVVLPPTECVLDHITCLLCRKIPNDSSSSIYLCTNNHLFCITCYSGGSVRGKKCRMTGCQEQVKKSIDPILHDIFLNSFFNCGYSRCPEIILGGDLKTHQNFCHYRPIECPSCKVSIQFENYIQHLDSDHKVNTPGYFSLDDSVQDIAVHFPCLDNYGNSVTHYHKFQGEHFFTHVIIKPKDICVWIQYYGDARKEGDFITRISLKNNYGHRTEVTTPINPIHSNYKNVLKTVTYAHFSKEFLKCYLTEPNNNNNGHLLAHRKDYNETMTGEVSRYSNHTNREIITLVIQKIRVKEPEREWPSVTVHFEGTN
ncbi:unnamed protein product [Allacma fusca]|uniref:RING-type E3 ubiquitin transferase n=1 Tax=Allacma fusca TaxID=39272 RepID=A0A8J2PL19_9HEXA|nr:unnamed protein product [Allacma fusca]